MKRTLMLKNRELLDFDFEPETKQVRILDAPEADDPLLASLGFGGPMGEKAVSWTIAERRMALNRDDMPQILDAFGASSNVELVFRGHGLSLVDQLWYRKPGSTERWEDINFFDNEWDTSFGTAILMRDYRHIASCSLETPDVTTLGHMRKAWERTPDGIRMIKEPLFENGCDIEGALLASKLCTRLFGQNAARPLYAVKRYDRPFSASPLMISRDEELVQGSRLFAKCGFDEHKAQELIGPVASQDYVDILVRSGVPDAYAGAAKVFAFKALSLLADMHAGNFGIICNVETGACRAALPFDYDRAFGLLSADFPLASMCNNPAYAMLLCAKEFSNLDPSWDWSWYDPRTLDGFEERIAGAYTGYDNLPPNFGDLVARLFVIQRNYINTVALER